MDQHLEYSRHYDIHVEMSHHLGTPPVISSIPRGDAGKVANHSAVSNNSSGRLIFQPLIREFTLNNKHICDERQEPVLNAFVGDPSFYAEPVTSNHSGTNLTTGPKSPVPSPEHVRSNSTTSLVLSPILVCRSSTGSSPTPELSHGIGSVELSHVDRVLRQSGSDVTSDISSSAPSFSVANMKLFSTSVANSLSQHIISDGPIYKRSDRCDNTSITSDSVPDVHQPMLNPLPIALVTNNLFERVTAVSSTLVGMGGRNCEQGGNRFQDSDASDDTDRRYGSTVERFNCSREISSSVIGDSSCGKYINTKSSSVTLNEHGLSIVSVSRHNCKEISKKSSDVSVNDNCLQCLGVSNLDLKGKHVDTIVSCRNGSEILEKRQPRELLVQEPNHSVNTTGLSNKRFKRLGISSRYDIESDKVGLSSVNLSRKGIVKSICDTVNIKNSRVDQILYCANIRRLLFYTGFLFLYFSIVITPMALAQTNPCADNSTCAECNVVSTTYYCNCMDNDSVVEAVCSNNVTGVCDTCEAAVELNYTTCSESNTSHVICTCLPGYTGPQCDTPIDYCENVTCLHNATCQIDGNNFTCECQPGWDGQLCETNVGVCDAVQPCLNNATCQDLADGYNCSCAEGYTGTTCEAVDCSQINCNSGSCEVNGSQWECSCPPFHNGVYCELTSYCEGDPCGSAGNCTENSTGYYCACFQGFTGVNCSTSIDECASSPCDNGGTCSSQPDGYTCTCVAGFTDQNCTTDIDDCLSLPCINGGTCNDSVNGYTCECAAGYTGLDCSVVINPPCVSQPCAGGGTCVPVGSEFTCTCAPGFTGTTCESDINECFSTPCRNGGTCNDHVNSFSCACPGVYTGPTCEACGGIEACGGRGNCSVNQNGTKCSCEPGYDGSTCEIQVADNTDDTPVGLIVGLTVGLFVLLLIILLSILLALHMKKKRATAGTYRPSEQETKSSRVDFSSVLKKPPEERLI